MKKREVKGQSGVITIILIILMILVAIVILWNVVIFTLKNSSDEASINQFAFKGEIKYALDKKVNPNDWINVSVNRGSGGGNITGFKLVFEFLDGSSKVYENRISYPNEFETKVYSINGINLNPILSPSDFSSLNKISLYYIFNENRKEKISILLDTANMPSSTSSGSTCPDSCLSLDYQCGTQTICGISLNCGECNGLTNVLSATCVNAKCNIINCNTNFGNCDNNHMNGCEINLLTNNNNCGSCGNDCAAQGKICSSGSCVSLTLTSVYNMVGIINPAGATSNKATYGGFIQPANPAPGSGTEASSANYNYVSSIDNIVWNSPGTGINTRPYKMFRFYVTDSGITEISATAKGYGHDNTGGVSTYNLNIYNFNTRQWELLATHSNNAITQISGVKIASLENYKNVNDYIYVETVGPAGVSFISDDYVELKITYTG